MWPEMDSFLFPWQPFPLLHVWGWRGPNPLALSQHQSVAAVVEPRGDCP